MFYRVDLTSLPMPERIAACKRMSEGGAWDVFEELTDSGLVSAKVMWNLPEDFESSSCFPKGCKCVLLGK